MNRYFRTAKALVCHMKKLAKYKLCDIRTSVGKSYIYFDVGLTDGAAMNL